MDTWLTADWHCGEDRFKLMGRPFTSPQQMIDTLVENHNKLVAPDAHVYMLGDVCASQHPEYLDQVSRFNGTKVLLRGNHDRGISDKEFSPYFQEIIPEGEGIYIEFGGIDCYLTHYPTCGKKDCFNLVGHVHNAWRIQLNMLNVGVDANHFIPVNTKVIPRHIESLGNFYDLDAFVCYDDINTSHWATRGKKEKYFNRQ